MTEVKQLSRSKVYDQFLLAELFGGVYYQSSMGVGVLRVLFNNGEPMAEGTLSARIGSRTCRPEWFTIIERLRETGYVAIQPTGRGTARTISLTDKAKEFLDDKGILVEVEQPTEVAG
jgi:hypothetical protein